MSMYCLGMHELCNAVRGKLTLRTNSAGVAQNMDQVHLITWKAAQSLGKMYWCAFRLMKETGSSSGVLGLTRLDKMVKGPLNSLISITGVVY